MIKIILVLLFMMEQTMALTLTSPSFEHNANIPSLYTCDGKSISPRLSWADAPAGMQTFVLICDDPDAPWEHGFIGFYSIFLQMLAISRKQCQSCLKELLKG
jgi:phosphatidylethanolamine-binding protein (PEBP) family uncharacterized protein